MSRARRRDRLGSDQNVVLFAAFGPWAMDSLYLPFSIAGIIGLTLLARRWDAGGPTSTDKPKIAPPRHG